MEKPILFNEEMIRAIWEGRKTQTRRVVKPGTKCPYGQVGDTLWVREKHAIECPYGPAKGCDNPDHVIYWASEEEIVRDSITKWRPSIHMPRWASRMTLRVEGVRIETIQGVTLNDILAEGCPVEHRPENCNGMSHAAFAWFEHLWDSINCKRGFGWQTNPQVRVIEFSLIRR